MTAANETAKLKFRDAGELAGYQERWCRRCLHHPGCPLLAAATGEIATDEAWRILDTLIPTANKGFAPYRCRLFALNAARAE